ncbi:MAG: SusC/RagA family TonB-linked outer membrane protein [Flavobacteriaceae bacterium]
MKVNTYAWSILWLLLAPLSWAQVRSGQVTDENNLPLPGASVVIEGSSRGTTTDFDGNYQIEAQAGEVLLFSYVGYADQRITVGSSDNYNIQMQSDTELEEVVLTALGLEKRKDEDLSSTSVVDVGQLQQSGESGILQGLAGKTSGINITRNSGDPGAGAYIQIRGQNTILGSSSPLIVLDGAIISNSSFNQGVGDDIGQGSTSGVVQQSRLNDLNPDDIESISVLKGASAAAIYGTGAANGVLVIKTKRGAKGGKQWSFNVKSSISIDEVNREWTKQSTYGQGSNGNDSPTSSLSYGGKIRNRAGGNDDVDTGSPIYFVSDSGRTYYPINQKNSREIYNQTNRDAVFQTGLVYENSFGLRYNSGDSSTYFSIANWDQEGIYKGASDYRRTTITMNNDTQFSENLSLKISTNYTSIDSNRIQTGSNLNGLYLGYLRTSPDFDIRDYKGTHFNDGVSTPNSHRSYRRYLGSFRTFDAEKGTFQYTAPTYNNPIWTIKEQKNINEVHRFIISPELKYTFNPNLSLTAQYSLDHFNDNREDFWPAGSAGDGSQGKFEELRFTESTENLNIYLNGNYDISSAVGFSGIMGLQNFQYSLRGVYGEESSFTNPDEAFLNFGNATSQNSNITDYSRKDRKSGAYAVLNFDFWDELLLELTGRAEYLSSIPDQGLIFYPSASIGWDFSSYVDTGVLSFAKVRASYGEVGIEPVPYSTRTVFSTGGIRSSWGDGFDGSLYGNPLTRSDARGNPDLKEERKSEFELGFDLRFFNDDISLSATYYNNETKDGLLELPTPPSNGFTEEYRNAATITNEGLEIDFNASLLNTDRWFWSMNLNFTTNRNEVESLSGSDYFILNGFTSTSSGVAEGQPFGVLRGGVFQRDADGNFILNDKGFPMASTEDDFVGDPNPNWRAGLGTQLSYNNFTFSAFVETSQGNDVWNGTAGVLRYFGIGADTEVETVASRDLMNADGEIIPAGTTFRGREVDFGGGPVAVDQDWWTGNGGGFGDVSEEAIEDASWVRVREITLSYNFPKSLLDPLKISSMQLSFSGRNLFLFTDVENFDPENNLTGSSKGRGLEYFSNPGTRSYLTTLRIAF